jgi:hypothetical protein
LDILGQLWKYLQVNKDKLNGTLIAGDLTAMQFGQWIDGWNVSDVVSELKGIWN